MVELIVICDACGNREIGWAWHDRGGLLRYDNHAESDGRPVNPDEPACTPDEELPSITFGGHTTAMTSAIGVLTADSMAASNGLLAYCSKHGGVVAAEAVDLEALTTARVHRVRAFVEPGDSV